MQNDLNILFYFATFLSKSIITYNYYFYRSYHFTFTKKFGTKNHYPEKNSENKIKSLIIIKIKLIFF